MKYLVILFSALSIVACGGGNGGSSTGQVSAGITDAPVDGAEAVVIYFTEAVLHGPDGNTVLPIEDLNQPAPSAGRSIDLLQLQSGQWTGLFEDVITAGQYSWIRLTMDLDPAMSYIQINGEQFPLRCTSCENNGYKLNRSFEIPADGVLTLMLDFDLRKSITLANNGTEYILRPTVRVVDADISGVISGTVDPTLISSLGGFSGCSVYAFAGSDAQADDIYIPVGTAIPAGQNNPISTANVEFVNNGYEYRLAFLPAGQYTVALTCDAENDNADSDDELTFGQAMNVSVVAGNTTTANFSVPVASP